MAGHKRQLLAIVLIANYAASTWASGQNSCDKPLYFTFDTGHMAVAGQIAYILNRQGVKATFFAANERTKVGEGTLGSHWASWWKLRGTEGHEFATHTFDHVYWRADVPGAAMRFRFRPSAGALEGRELVWDAATYCAQLDQANSRLQELTGKKPLPLFRAPGGKTSPKLLAAAKSCGYGHVGWAPAGFLGDELSSEVFSNDALLATALRDIRSGDILMAHLGIWSRKDPWAPTVLEPLIVGLKAKGFCFQTLRDHPAYKSWIATPGPLAK